MKFLLCIYFTVIVFTLGAQDASYNLQWLEHYAGNANEKGLVMRHDDQGNLYLLGNFSGTIDFDPSIAVNELVSFGDVDISIAKWDVSGQLIWVKQLGGTDFDRANSLCISSSGELIITGYFYGSADFDPGPAQHLLSSLGESDIFILSLDTNGNFNWVKQIGGIKYDTANYVACDQNGKLAITGSFSQSVDFDPGSGTDIKTSNSFGDDVFLLILWPDGSYDWSIGFGDSFWDAGFSISFNVLGDIWLAGVFSGSVDFDPGTTSQVQFGSGLINTFAARYDANGNLQQVLTILPDLYAYPNSILQDNTGNIYLSGYFEGTCDFESGSGVHTRSSSGMEDAYIASFQSNGSLNWLKHLHGTGSDYLFASSLNENGELQILGSFENTLNLDTGNPADTLLSQGASDIVILGYDLNGNWLYAKTIGGPDYDYGYGLYNDQNGLLYVNGSFNAQADFDIGPGENLVTAGGNYDVFVGKYSYLPSDPKPIEALDTVCARSEIQVGIPPVSGAQHYDWLLPAGWSIVGPSDTNQLILMAGNSGGTIQVTVSNNSGSKSSNDFVINIIPSPSLNVQPAYAGDTLCFASTILFHANASGHQSLIWDNAYSDGSALILDQTGQFMYRVVALGANGCSANDSVYFTVSECLSVNEKIPQSALLIGPNPVVDQLVIYNPQQGHVVYHICDLKGAILRVGELESNQSIPCGFLEAGLYYLLINGERLPFVKR